MGDLAALAATVYCCFYSWLCCFLPPGVLLGLGSQMGVCCLRLFAFGFSNPRGRVHFGSEGRGGPKWEHGALLGADLRSEGP